MLRDTFEIEELPLRYERGTLRAIETEKEVTVDRLTACVQWALKHCKLHIMRDNWWDGRRLLGSRPYNNDFKHAIVVFHLRQSSHFSTSRPFAKD